MFLTAKAPPMLPLVISYRIRDAKNKRNKIVNIFRHKNWEIVPEKFHRGLIHIAEGFAANLIFV